MFQLRLKSSMPVVACVPPEILFVVLILIQTAPGRLSRALPKFIVTVVDPHAEPVLNDDGDVVIVEKLVGLAPNP